MTATKKFQDYKEEGHNWITLATGEYYPNVLEDACLLYEPVLVLFGQLLKISETSQRLFLQINEVSEIWMRIQLCRVFRKYISPETPVEMLKRKTEAAQIIERFGKGFRPVQEAQAAFFARPMPDEALCALLWEYKSRGSKGYDLTERFFEMINSYFPELSIKGPHRAGQDILLSKAFDDYPNPNRPVDFILYDTDGETPLAIGLARYDGDRGGAQEDDRTGGYFNCAREILGYADATGKKLKVIFVNDGPGLLLGSMWRDYSSIEAIDEERVMVTTLRMVPDRITYEWLKS
jgi:hypothetical protein